MLEELFLWQLENNFEGFSFIVQKSTVQIGSFGALNKDISTKRILKS